MPKFSYTAKTKDSRTVHDIEQVSSQDELIAKLRSRGLFVVSVTEIKDKSGYSASGSVQAHAKRNNICLDDLTFLARNLAVTLSSGITLLRSLEILSSQTSSARLGKILNECSAYVRGGLSFSESIAKYPDVFPMLWQSIVEVGEASGNLPFGLDKLADYLEMRTEFERKIKSALIYPVILMLVCCAALFIFFKFILPKFTDLFSQFNIELPLATKIIFNMSQAFSKYWFIGVILIAVVIAAIMIFKDDPEVKKRWDRFLIKTPLISNLAMLICMERFTSTMHILLESGLPLVYTLEASAKSIGNTVLQKDLVIVKEKVREGSSLSAELMHLQAFPGLVSEMTKVGEETGTLPAVFDKVSHYYQKELITKVERIVLLFEPLMIVFMGVVIGSIVVALFMPIFKLSTLGG